MKTPVTPLTGQSRRFDLDVTSTSVMGHVRIGELADKVGVTTRTVRYYHHCGLLPEPMRGANGYREYGLRDAVALSRVRRLAELGLALDEIRDVMASEVDRDLRKILADLDRDLARQQREIVKRRARLAALGRQKNLGPESSLSPELAGILGRLSVDGSEVAEFDRQVLGLVDDLADAEERAAVIVLLEAVAQPGTIEAVYAAYLMLDELAGSPADDQRVDEVATALAQSLPRELLVHMSATNGDNDWRDLLVASLPGAQGAALRRLMEIADDTEHSDRGNF